MARDILSEYGQDISTPQAPRATNGGQLDKRDVNNYQNPVGPSNINDGRSPGLHGENLGSCGTQGRY